uniref:Uncharacterized protein n=1 Tax=Oryza brachyantha TaxID=4533 RepID=J3MYN5_ORYBR
MQDSRVKQILIPYRAQFTTDYLPDLLHDIEASTKPIKLHNPGPRDQLNQLIEPFLWDRRAVRIQKYFPTKNEMFRRTLQLV